VNTSSLGCLGLPVNVAAGNCRSILPHHRHARSGRADPRAGTRGSRKAVAAINDSGRLVGDALAPPLLGVIDGDGSILGVYVVSALVAGLSAGLIARLRLDT